MTAEELTTIAAWITVILLLLGIWWGIHQYLVRLDAHFTNLNARLFGFAKCLTCLAKAVGKLEDCKTCIEMEELRNT
jgi:hypothetical protein